MRFFLSLVTATLLLSSDVAAHADTITTFTLTHGTDTIQFSIPDSASYTQENNFGGAETFLYSVPISVDGVVHYSTPFTDYAEEGFESLQAPGVGAELFVAYQVGILNGTPQVVNLFEQGPQIYTLLNGKPEFTPETVVFPVFDELIPSGTSYLEPQGTGDKLVVTQVDSAATPEPSSFLLLGTGLLGAFAAVRNRLTNRNI
jgi:hypothetical protein